MILEIIKKMDFIIKFYKEAERWYADIPNVSKEDCEMVLGADDLLERLSMGFNNVIVQFSTCENENNVYSYNLIEHDDYGGTYQNIKNGEQFWLCNVTHDVCGEHPEKLFINKIKNS
jgi:hypothetical protein